MGSYQSFSPVLSSLQTGSLRQVQVCNLVHVRTGLVVENISQSLVGYIPITEDVIEVWIIVVQYINVSN